MTTEFRVAVLTALGLLSAWGAVVRGQERPSQESPAGTFEERLEVRVVNVEVVVTDAEGNRVQGLTAEDFRLRVDGEEVPIEYFTEVRGGSAVAPGERGPTFVPTLDPGKGVGTSYLVFIDDYYTVPRDRDKALERMRKQLPLLGGEDRMAVVAYDGQEMTMLSSWSRNLEILDEVYRDAQARPAYGLQRYSERRNEDLLLRESILRFGPDSDLTRLGVDERYYVDRTTRQVEKVVSAVTSTLRSFAQPPGRKVMLLLSGGWPFDPVDYVVDNVTRPIVEAGLKRADDLLAPISDTANLLGYTLYTVDIPGLQASAVDDKVSPILAEQVNSVAAVSFEREMELHRSLTFLAEETGGRAMLNGQNDGLFETAVNDTRSYYWLGFSPERQGDDQRHDVEVEVLRPGLKVRSREGYLDFSRDREVNMAIESALLFGTPPSPDPLLVQVGRPDKAGRGRMLVPLVVAIPTDGITLLQVGPAKWAARLELRLAVRDEDGSETGDIPSIPIEFSVSERPPAGTFVRWDTNLKMRRKAHDVVVALYDRNSGAILSTSLEVTPE